MNGILIYELPWERTGHLFRDLAVCNISQIFWGCFAFWFSCKNLHKNYIEIEISRSE